MSSGTFHLPPLIELASSSTFLLLVKVTALLLVATLLLAATRRASASLRHGLVATALFGSLLLPAVTWMAPSWPLLPHPATAASPSERPGGSAVSEQRQTTAATSAPVASNTRTEPTRRATAGLGPSASRPPSDRLSFTSVWLAGGLVLLSILALRIGLMYRQVARADLLDEPAWRALCDELCTTLGVRTPVVLRRRAAGTMPLIWGLWRPTILLPADCGRWPDERRRAVLGHELAHALRRDVSTSLLAHLTCAIYWFHPFTWFLHRTLAREHERACDDLVLHHGMRPATYADHLLHVATRYRTHNSLAPVMAARSLLEGRIMAILDHDTDRTPTTRRTRLTLAAILLSMLVPLASMTWVQPAIGQEGDETAPYGSDSADFDATLTRLGIDRTDVDALLDGLRADDPGTRGASAWALGATGDERAVEPLIYALQDRDARTRQWAARSLASLDDERAIDALIETLRDTDAETRQWAIRGLGELGTERAIEALAEQLDDSDAEVRQWAVRVLDGHRLAVDRLLDRLDDSDAEVRQWIVRTAGHDQRARARLIDLLETDPDTEVREWAARALGGEQEMAFGWTRPEVEPLMPGLDRPRAAPADDEVIDVLVRTLSSDVADLREWSVRALGNVGDARAIAPLVDRMDDEEEDVREWAVRSLGALRDARAVGPVIDALGSNSDDIREAAVRSLGLLQDERMVEPLLRSLGDPSPDVREWATRALGAYGDPRVIDAIEALGDDPSEEVRHWVDRALAQLRSDGSSRRAR